MSKPETCVSCVHSKPSHYHDQVQPYCEMAVLEYPRIGAGCRHYEPRKKKMP